ncbi:MAG: IS3 family transposase [Flavobacteriaceae bacterium]|nr:MAG: IS3 family transposase [Flavobacteriaceae bacterium]QMU62893.1 MAG: IS3 family transposase [Flavobacteriaceae bacterium]QMU64608.1 MAG: IS3 family transposase [Flavobacteriaceae bacterium]QMU65188.1 MAG: IS3 family transposase [Flavobacteriaceae bacterium]QMU65357.1 MAG: IS3 family transposase [Flavobacteriaceae bacterium]
MKRRKYSKEFKIKAVELSNVRGNTKQIAMELGISADLIYRWRRELEQRPDLAFSGNGVKQLTEDQKELERLRKQLKDVTMERDNLKKGREHLLQERSEVLKFIKDYSREYPVGKMCKIFKISRNSYYRSKNYVPSDRDGKNRMLLSEIHRICERSKSTYGSPRITEELKAKGFKVSRSRVARLMKKHGIKAVRKKKFVVTTDSKHQYPVADNVLDRDFKATAAAQKWVSDITYLKTAQGWLYLTVIIDLFDRKVIGWSLSNGLKARQTIIAAWRMAVNNRMPCEGMIFHSDRGVQYASHAFVNILKSYHVTPSMSRKGNCWDNAVAESFFKTIKTELMIDNKFISNKSLQIKVFEYIETWYNRYRRHSALGYKNIIEFEKLYQIKNVA